MLVSIIIPTLNEELALPECLKSIRLASEGLEELPEILVADANSQDNTADIALRAGCRLVDCEEAGRGVQLQSGALQASGDYLLFIHADCSLEPGAIQAMVEALEDDQDLVGGNFRLRFDGQDSLSRFMTTFYNDLRTLKLYYGDSGIFVRRGAWEALGGFKPELPIMEDFDFVQRLEAFGPTTRIESHSLTTSSRRFHNKSIPSTLFLWAKMHYLYWRQAPPDQLKATYAQQR